MLATDKFPHSIESVLPHEDATRELAAAVADMLVPGDIVALSGDLGSGKTFFAREMIRHLAKDPQAEVPSPTFTLVQQYELPRFPLMHVDLYRISDPEEITQLGITEMLDDAVTLVEWPERADGALPVATLEVLLAVAPALGPTHRRVRLKSRHPASPNVVRLLRHHRFLQEAGFGGAERVRLQGDASTRIYERLVSPTRTGILMIAPRRPDGPPVRDGKPYSAIAHLAEDVAPFVALARGLHERGFSAPEVYAADLEAGVLALEDLGSEGVLSGEPPSVLPERYTAALDVLAALHALQLPDTLPVAPGTEHKIPPYDIDALLIEVELLIEWYLPQQGKEPTDELRKDFVELWRSTLEPITKAQPTWVLRDYHSPNLLWLPEREGIRQVGILDFQDAVMGPAAYDVVSLLQDARVDVPVQLEDSLVGRYLKARRAADRTFDLNQWIEDYAIMGAQRASKILGIFARLEKRDGKPQYLAHQPRVWRNLRKCFAHPSLRRMKAWYDLNVPPPRTDQAPAA